jgi:DNA-binding MarR family transcriptional regulator
MTDRRAVHRSHSNEVLAAPAHRAASRHASKRRNGGKATDLGVLKIHLGYFLRRVQVWVFQDFIRSLASIDIRPAQYSVLAVVGANRGLSQADVAALLGIERARLVRLLDRLEKRGLTQRLASAVDRRSHVLKLTPAGQALLKRAITLAAQHEERLAEQFGPAQHKFMLEALRDFDVSH